jgi:hypothetical protein
MIIGRGVQSTQIHAPKMFTLSKAVHVFARLAHGTYHCTAFSKYGSVQSAREMNRSLTVKPPTEISLSPDTVSSILSAVISNCDLLVETRNLYSTDSLISPKCTSGYLIQFRYISLYCPEPVRILLVGNHVWQLSEYSPLNFQMFF